MAPLIVLHLGGLPRLKPSAGSGGRWAGPGGRESISAAAGTGAAATRPGHGFAGRKLRKVQGLCV